MADSPSGQLFPSVDGPPASQRHIVHPTKYVSEGNVDLAIVKKGLNSKFDGKVVVEDMNGSMIFKAIGAKISLHKRHHFIDAEGARLLTFHKDIVTLHGRWEVFKGESTLRDNLVFSITRSSMFQVKPVYNVFLANNSKEDVCDFKIKGSLYDGSCGIYAGESKNRVAEVRKQSARGDIMGSSHFNVTVYPNTDYAFIAALVVILETIN